MFKEFDAEDENLNLLHRAYAFKITEKIPSKLLTLDNNMMNRIDKGIMRDAQYCKNVLGALFLHIAHSLSLSLQYSLICRLG